MHIHERQEGDLKQLRQRIRSEHHAQQRDRYRAVSLAIEGYETLAIQHTLCRSRGFVQRWTYAYRDGGIAALQPGKPTGAPPKLALQQQEAFKRRMLGGPTEDDAGLCTLRGRDAVRILEREFGVAYSLSGVYDLLHRLDMACLKPRPKHRKNDEQAMQQWLDEAPFLSSACAGSRNKTSKSKSGSRTKPASVSKAR